MSEPGDFELPARPEPGPQDSQGDSVAKAMEFMAKMQGMGGGPPKEGKNDPHGDEASAEQVSEEHLTDKGNAEILSNSAPEEKDELQDEARKNLKEALSLAEGGNLKEAAEKLGVSEEHIEVLRFTNEQIGENKTLLPKVEDDIVKKFTTTVPPIGREQAKVWIETLYPQLEDDAKERLLNRLEEEKNQDEPLPDEEAEQTKTQGEALKEQLEQAEKEIDDSKDLSEEEKIRYKRQVHGLRSRIKDFFAEGEKGKVWARRAGKTLYISMITAFILLAFLMHTINKASKSGGRR